MKLRPGFWRLAVAAAAVVGALALPALPAAASVAAPAAPHSLSSASYQAAGAASAASCATSRPRTGRILYAGIKGGLGRLTVKNHLSQDSVIVLVRGRSKAIGVYVRAHATTTVHNIKPGTYTIYFTTGSLFRKCTGRFTRGASYWRIKQHLTFLTLPHFSVDTLTIFAVKGGGNAPTSPIGSKGFPAP